MSGKNTHLIAHRGESYDAPENTLGAINLAWEKGAQAIEVDVRLTADNKICVIHDRTTLRTTGKNLVVRKVKMSQLKELDARLWKGEKWKGERIPTLAEALSTVPPNGKMIVEIKSSSKILGKLKQEIGRTGLRKDQVKIIAFNLNTASEAKKIIPKHKVLWLVEIYPPFFNYFLEKNSKSIIKKVKQNALDGVNIGNSKYLTQSFIYQLKHSQLSIYTWTINCPLRANELQRS